MPDDDRYTRDRVRTLDPLNNTLWKRAREGRETGTSPELLILPEDDFRPLLKKAFKQVKNNISQPDFEDAAHRAHDLAQTLKDDGPESIDLCAGYRTSGMQALLDQAVSTILSEKNTEEILKADTHELAAQVGEKFAFGVIRRYALDRIAPFSEGDAAETGDALDFLELADLTFTSTVLRELVEDLLP